MQRATIALMFAFACAMPAQAGDTYRIVRAEVADGGATLSGGAFRLSGTAGQPVVGTVAAGSFVLAAGFWNAASAPADDRIFANGFDP
jgi:hypothetical protein